MKKLITLFSTLVVLTGLMVVGASPAHASTCSSVLFQQVPTAVKSGNLATYVATANGCTSPRYKFWIGNPMFTTTNPIGWYPSGGTAWQTSGTFSWNTTGADLGEYEFSVWAKDSTSGNQYDAFTGTSTNIKVYADHGNQCPGTNCITSHTNTTHPSGYVLHQPKVVLIYWGSAWSTGWNDPLWNDGDGHNYQFGSATFKTYMNSMFTNLSGGSWQNIFSSRYCDGQSAGNTTCGTGTTLIGTAGWIGSYVDTSSNPNTAEFPADLTAEITHVAHDVGGIFAFDPNTYYYVFLPHGANTAGGYTYHGYSTWAYDTTKTLTWGVQPYDGYAQNFGAGYYKINPDSFGHMYYDDVGLVAGHEFAEAASDPEGGQTSSSGWFIDTAPQYEIADVCQTSSQHYYHLTSHWPAAFTFFVEQQLQTNDRGCTNN